MSNIFPLTPAELRLRVDLGSHGDTGNELHAKADRIKDETASILADTSVMDPKFGVSGDTGTIFGDIAAVKTIATAIDTDTGNILTELANATYGLSALEVKVITVDTVVDTISAKLGTPVGATFSADIAAIKAETALIKTDTTGILTVIGTPTEATIALDLAAILSQVTGIQNNTRTTVAILPEMEVPPSGNSDFLIQVNNYDTVGNMEDPDSNSITVAVVSYGGTDRSGNLVNDSGVPTTTMIRDSIGRYHIRYRVASTAAVNEGLLFTFTLAESAVTRVIDRTSRIVEEISSTFTASDRSDLQAILTDTADMQPKLGTPVTSISADIAAVKSVVDSIQVDTDAIEVDTQDIQASINLIESKNGSLTFDRATDSLEAISEAIAAMDVAPVFSSHFRYTKSTGSLASGTSEVAAIDTDSENLNIKEIRCTTTAAVTDFTVEIFEDAAATLSLMKYEKANQIKGDLKLAIDLIFVNRDGTPLKKLYVKVSNVTGATGVFAIEVRGIVLQVN